MKLSVVVLTYNQENTVAQALDSILSQEHPYSMEIIVGDDGSSDRTSEIVSEYAVKFPDIVKPVLRKQNLGLIGNYFDVISRCTGEYVACCAGDDYWLTGKVASQLAYMEVHPECTLIYGKASILHTSNGIIEGELEGNEDDSFESLIRGNHVPAVTICVRRKAVVEYFREIRPQRKGWLMEDYPLVLWAALKGKIHYDPTVLAVYRKNESSVSHSPDYANRLRFEKNVYLIQKFFLKLKGDRRGLSNVNQALIINNLTLRSVDRKVRRLSRHPLKYMFGRLRPSLKLIGLVVAPAVVGQLLKAKNYER